MYRRSGHHGLHQFKESEGSNYAEQTDRPNPSTGWRATHVGSQAAAARCVPIASEIPRLKRLESPKKLGVASGSRECVGVCERRVRRRA